MFLLTTGQNKPNECKHVETAVAMVPLMFAPVSGTIQGFSGGYDARQRRRAAHLLLCPTHICASTATGSIQSMDADTDMMYLCV